jgi:hypothetical protein
MGFLGNFRIVAGMVNGRTRGGGLHSARGVAFLFKVISRAYEHYSLILTTNLAFEEWTEIFGSERLTGALLDRLTHRCHILEANGESYLFRQAGKGSTGRPLSKLDSTPKEKDK